MIRKLLMAATALVLLLAAPASAQYEGLIVNPGKVSAGGTVTVSGQGCSAGETVVIEILRGPPQQNGIQGIAGQAGPPEGGPIEVAVVNADAAGNFTATFTVPESLHPGMHTVRATCGAVVQGTSLIIQGPPAGNPGSRGSNGRQGFGNEGSVGGGRTGSRGALARTGSSLNTVGLLGAGLLTVGGLVLLTTRKRQHRSA